MRDLSYLYASWTFHDFMKHPSMIIRRKKPQGCSFKKKTHSILYLVYCNIMFYMGSHKQIWIIITLLLYIFIYFQCSDMINGIYKLIYICNIYFIKYLNVKLFELLPRLYICLTRIFHDHCIEYFIYIFKANNFLFPEISHDRVSLIIWI